MSTPRTVLRNSLLLASFAALAAGLIAGTWRSTSIWCGVDVGFVTVTWQP